MISVCGSPQIYIQGGWCSSCIPRGPGAMWYVIRSPGPWVSHEYTTISTQFKTWCNPRSGTSPGICGISLLDPWKSTGRFPPWVISNEIQTIWSSAATAPVTLHCLQWIINMRTIVLTNSATKNLNKTVVLFWWGEPFQVPPILHADRLVSEVVSLHYFQRCSGLHQRLHWCVILHIILPVIISPVFPLPDIIPSLYPSSIYVPPSGDASLLWGLIWWWVSYGWLCASFPGWAMVRPPLLHPLLGLHQQRYHHTPLVLVPYISSCRVSWRS